MGVFQLRQYADKGASRMTLYRAYDRDGLYKTTHDAETADYLSREMGLRVTAVISDDDND
jgi:hypothetical protein